MKSNDGKKFFLVASSDMERKKQLCEWVGVKFPDAVIYTASDYMECLVKIKNAPPHVLISDFELPKGRPGQAIETIMLDKKSRLAMIIIGGKPSHDSHLDGIAMGRLQFLDGVADMEVVHQAIMQVANYAFQSDTRNFKLKFLKPGEHLIQEGDECRNVFIVKKGELKAYQKSHTGESIFLGKINAGEFVGEMAYFNGEKRMASVVALSDCELIEVPPQTFENVIYKRPSWVKILFETLTKRIKRLTELQKDR